MFFQKRQSGSGGLLAQSLEEIRRLADEPMCLFQHVDDESGLAKHAILKPTVPVSPVRNIPSFEETRRRTPARDASSQKANAAGNEGLLIDFATPPQPADTAMEKLDKPFDTFNATSAIRDEMAATKERDEKERRERERQTILEKREARRKSMGTYTMRYNQAH